MCAQRRLRSAKTQISLGIRPVWSESSLCAQWVAKDPRFLHADSKDSDQTGRMPRLIWVFAGRTLILLVLSCRGSFFLFVLSSVAFTCNSKAFFDLINSQSIYLMQSCFWLHHGRHLHGPFFKNIFSNRVCSLFWREHFFPRYAFCKTWRSGKHVKQTWASSWDYGTYRKGDQRRHRRACASAQSLQSLRCSHTWSMEVYEESDQNPDI